MTKHNSSLTPGEKQVAELLCQGLTVTEIMAILELSKASVRLHMHHLRIKFGVRREVDLRDYFGDGCQDKEALMK